MPAIEFFLCWRRHALNFQEAPGNNCMSFLPSFLTHNLLFSNSTKCSLQVTVSMFLTQRKIVRPTTKIEGNQRILVIPLCQNRRHLHERIYSPNHHEFGLGIALPLFKIRSPFTHRTSVQIPHHIKMKAPMTIRRTVRRTVNVIIALAQAALGCGGFVYFYFIAAAWKGWTVISGVMGGVGLYWLSAEYLNPDQDRPKLCASWSMRLPSNNPAACRRNRCGDGE
jgi:hypothetical protein